ncbi:hypothetical protein A1O1_04619 [Capronia coronata CBS 617.96]|uniref:Conserved oligomeric Golgi complex subunit 8 n=1 Tax=Capronia coronata CBS 617.96 TaxID=1182541 RepID=W9YZG6_9EURO|nr:uncharacterized protein A1O1_04619 [Capronia coronata CBS 617.96]EXJ87694.1 hypothetical protein A1O1_04619 [Capronia coronata CBS 617.96]
MADTLYDLLKPHLPSTTSTTTSSSTNVTSSDISKYLTRLVSLRLEDLTTTEPESLSQAAQSNLLSIQALSSRSHRTTTTSSDHLSTLRSSLPQLSSSIQAIRQSIPALDSKAVEFASSYNRSKDDTSGSGNALLNSRREAALLARQADKVQDILELPSLLSAAIASAGSMTGTTTTTTTTSSGANYTQALDLFAHIKRLQILYPDSQLVKSVVGDAEVAMKDMTTNLIASLRGQNIRLAAAIRMIGWLRRVAPELGETNTATTPSSGSSYVRSKQQQQQQQVKLPGLSTTTSATQAQQGEGHFGALFLCARLCTFLYMTEALAPLRDLADQETEASKSLDRINRTKTSASSSASSTTTTSRPEQTRKPSTSGNPLHGQHTERYLKRYIEIFREQSFATISMYRNIFPQEEEEGLGGSAVHGHQSHKHSGSHPANDSQAHAKMSSLLLSLSLPPALQSFPLHLVEVFMATLKQYLPNVTDPSARESLLMQILYAANSLGRLGADFSLMIALLDEDEVDGEDEQQEREVGEVGEKEEEDEEVVTDVVEGDNATETKVESGPTSEAEGNEVKAQGHTQAKTDQADDEETVTEGAVSEPSSHAEHQPIREPEWVSVIKKHRVQAARLEALAAGQDKLVQRRESADIVVR